ncbi:MAG: HhH-GPD:Iron-sulfur cluster loop [Pseudomonadota bacterium]|jgi:endonuclease-3
MNSISCEEIFARFQTQNPHPTTELLYQSPFELLVAVILSAQATDKSVNLATPTLFAVANTPEKILALGEENLKNYIKNIGLYNSKATHIIKMCEKLIEQHHSQVPDNRKDLEALAGVGRKTANVILNTLFNEPTIAVDTHIFRIAQRIGLAHGRTVRDIEKGLIDCIPKHYQLHAHHWLILHGRYTCTARQPKCEKCLINDLCEAKRLAII